MNSTLLTLIPSFVDLCTCVKLPNKIGALDLVYLVKIHSIKLTNIYKIDKYVCKNTKYVLALNFYICF